MLKTIVLTNVLLLISAHVGFSISGLSFEAWINQRKYLEATLADDTIEAHIFDEKQSSIEPVSYYYLDRGYTCGKDLEKLTGASCKKTCFPSYKQEGIKFTLNTSSLKLKTCEYNAHEMLYEGYQAYEEEYRCPEGRIIIILVPALLEFQKTLNISENSYFEDISSITRNLGLIVKVQLEKKERFQIFKWVLELKKMKKSNILSPLRLPQDYFQVPVVEFLEDRDRHNQALQENAKRSLIKKVQQPSSALSLSIQAIYNECGTRFPAQKNEILRWEICKALDPKLKDEIQSLIQAWHQDIWNNVKEEMQALFHEGTRRYLENVCH